MSKACLGLLLTVMLSACAGVTQRQANAPSCNAEVAEIEALREKLRIEMARAATLQQKLDALKAIEQEIQQRRSPTAEATP